MHVHRKKRWDTWSASPTLIKKDLGSGGTGAHLPSLSLICRPAVQLDLSTEMICGSVCSPNPVTPQSPGAGSGQGG